MSHRSVQLAGMIRTTLAREALGIPPNKAKVVSVTDVELSADLAYADISVSAIEGVEHAVAYFKSRGGELRSMLAKQLTTYTVPTLRFHVDTSGEKAARIDKLIDSL